MSISSANRFRQVLEKLAAEPPGTKPAMLCYLLPEIERALASGKTWKQVWQCLAEEGLEINYKMFHRLLRRVRRKSRMAAAPSGKSLELTSPVAEKAEAAVEHDPLVNLRRVEANKPGFPWQSNGTQDELVLRRASDEATKLADN